MRPWLLFSSSSGETFRALWRGLSPEARTGLKATFVDRPCGASGVLRQECPGVAHYDFGKGQEFEESFLRWLSTQEGKIEKPIILLVGFFGILSPRFLQECRAPIVNTHPSLLPSFPGLDKSVHRLAYESVSLSGFSVHLVTEALDGGPILFQHPVWLDPAKSFEEVREDVRRAEQRWLPKLFEKLVRSRLSAEDRTRSSRALRADYELNLQSFQEAKGV